MPTLTGYRRTRLAVLVGAAAITVLVWTATAMLLWRDYRQIVATTQGELERVSLAATEHARRLLSQADIFLDSLEQIIALGDKDPSVIAGAPVTGRVAHLLSQTDGIMDVGVVDRSGMRHILPIKPDVGPVSVADRDYVRDARQDSITISAPILGRASQEWLIPVSRRSRDPDSPIAVVYSTIHLPALEGLYNSIRRSSGGAVSLFRKDGILLARAPALDGTLGKSFADGALFTDALSKAPEGTFVSVSLLDGKERLSVYHTVEPYGLVVVVSQTTSEVLAPWRHQIATSLLAALSITLLVGGGTMVLLRLLGNLRDAAHDLDRRVLERTAEVNRMMEARTNFLTSISHELRTPLNAVIGFSDALLAQVRGPIPERQAEYIRDIHRSGQHLLALVNDLLDSAAVDAGSLHLDESEASLSGIMDEALAMVRPRAAAAGIVIHFRMEPRDLVVFADRRRILQAVLNLCTNAVKYNRPGGGVRIEGWLDPLGGCRITVSDDGIGMTADELKTAMTPFGRASDPSIRAVEGTGLGLPLTASIIEFHGGSLTLDSQPGRGTTVTIMLPASRVRLAEEALV